MLGNRRNRRFPTHVLGGRKLTEDRRKNIQPEIQKRAEALALQTVIIAGLQAILIHSNKQPGIGDKFLPVSMDCIDPVLLANCRGCIEDAIEYAKRMVKI